MDDATALLARQLRLASVRNAYLSGNISEAQATKYLQGPISPGGENVDDSRFLHEPAPLMHTPGGMWLVEEETEHEYLERVLVAVEAGQLPSEPGLHIIDVIHDEWCAVFEGGQCNCDPELRVCRLDNSSRQ